MGETYTISEESGWSYKYGTAGDSVKITEEGKNYKSTLTNSSDGDVHPWLGDETRKKNVFGKAN